MYLGAQEGRHETVHQARQLRTRRSDVVEVEVQHGRSIAYRINHLVHQSGLDDFVQVAINFCFCDQGLVVCLIKFVVGLSGACECR